MPPSPDDPSVGVPEAAVPMHRPILEPQKDFKESTVDPQTITLWREKSLRRLFTVKNVELQPQPPQGDKTLDSRPELIKDSIAVLHTNDLGGYTVPAQGLYPYQWNWDSAIVAGGWAVFDERRAWEELESLFSGQWEDGMVPSIVFHKGATSYFPGPEIWGTPEKPMRSTGITQPPVAGISARFLYEHAEDKALAEEKMQALFPKLLASHRWFYMARDPNKTGLVAILHPWESGMDNSPAWDSAMSFEPDSLPPYKRADLTHVNADMRPDNITYDRYLTLLYRFRAKDYDPKELYFLSPFRVTDLCVNCILFRANRDLHWLARQLGHTDVVAEIEGWLDRGFRGMQRLWDEEAGTFKCQDQLTGELVDAGTSGGFLPLFGGMASDAQAARLARTLERWLSKVKYGVPSLDPEDPRFESKRYWRGPVWIIVNWMISNGLKHYGFERLAQRVKEDSIALTSLSGLMEYFEPNTGAGAGGHHFSWTAAMCLAWLDRPAAIAIGQRMSGPDLTKQLAADGVEDGLGNNVL